MQRAAMRALLIPVYGLAGLGTGAAYLQFVAGTIAGVEGIAKGRYFVGPLLSLLCLLGAFALWRVWSIGGRIWRYGAYMHATPRDHRYDAAGCAAVGVAFMGFVAISSVIHQGGEVVLLSILLLPAACLAIVTFLWIRSDPSRSAADNSQGGDPVRATAGLGLGDLPGVMFGTAIGLLGVYHFVPLPTSGMGICDWTVFYPIATDLWPIDRSEMFDGCGQDLSMLISITSILSLVCVVAGAIAAAIGWKASTARGAWAAAIVVVFVLARLVIDMSFSPSAPYIGWMESFIVGSLAVLGAGWLGYGGGVAARDVRGAAPNA